MAIRGQGRILEELQQLAITDEHGICARPVDDNVKHLQGEFIGPRDTPFEGGKFLLDIKIPDGYPFKPPKIRFITQIWHPNVSSRTGTICLDILKDEWASAITVKGCLLSIMALLSSPEPDDPQDKVVADMFKSNPDVYKKTAEYWTSFYAQGPTPNEEYGNLVKFLSESMAVENSVALATLSSKYWSINRAVRDLQKD